MSPEVAFLGRFLWGGSPLWRETEVMAMTAVGEDVDGPGEVTGCWCCGDRTVQASLLRLGWSRG